MGRIRVGISSWADPGLVQSSFYPAGAKMPEARLKYYASRFSIAEIDSTYHYFPTQRNLSVWLENTLKGFAFDVKAYSLFTGQPTKFNALPRTIREKYSGQIAAKDNVYLHHLPEEAVDELWGIFIGAVESLRKAERLGALLFQFPPWFHPEPRNFDYISRCHERLSQFQLAVEFRAGSWLGQHREQTLKFLREQGISLVCVDEPQGLKSSVPLVPEVTAPFAMVRFHGRNKENWERGAIDAAEKFNYLYSEDELKEWAPRVLSMAKSSRELHVIFKNKHEDFPVRNAIQMKELLGIT